MGGWRGAGTPPLCFDLMLGALGVSHMEASADLVSDQFPHQEQHGGKVCSEAGVPAGSLAMCGMGGQWAS